MIKTILYNKIGWLVASAIAIPNLILYFGFSSSLTLGTVIVGFVIIFSTLNAHFFQSNVIVNNISQSAFVVILVFLISIHFNVASLIGQTDIGRTGLSLVSLVIFIISASGFAFLLADASDREIQKSVLLVFSLFCGVVILFFIGFTPYGANASIKPMLPFTEPSHFAGNFLPFFIYACIVSSTIFRVCIVIAVTIAALAIQNMALLLGCLLVLLISTNYKTALFLLIIAVVVFNQTDMTYFADRANISIDNGNLSALVYLQGWQLILESWQNTSGWGLGFQQLGISATKVPASIVIESILGTGLNLMDGGFLLSKFLCEFGVAGVIIIIVYFKSALLVFRQLRLVAIGNVNTRNSVIISYCFVISFALEILIRGSGYFSPTALFTLAAIIYLHRIRISHKKWKNYVSI